MENTHESLHLCQYCNAAENTRCSIYPTKKEHTCKMFWYSEETEDGFLEYYPHDELSAP